MSGVVNRRAALRTQVRATELATNVTRVTVRDIRFPTSRAWSNTEPAAVPPDSSLAYITIDSTDGQKGFGYCPGIVPDNEALVPALEYMGAKLVGQSLDGLFQALLSSSDSDTRLSFGLTRDGNTSLEMARSAIVNALWDLFAKTQRQPLWRILCALEPCEIVNLVQWRHLRDAIDPAEVRERLEDASSERASRTGALQLSGLPTLLSLPLQAFESDSTLKNRLQDATTDGWSAFNVRLPKELNRVFTVLDLVRSQIDDHRSLTLEAGNDWSIPRCLEVIDHLGSYAPLWLSDVTHPDDILGYARLARASSTVPIAGGARASSIVQVKQLLQAKAINRLLLDPFRMGGVNNAVAGLLLADAFGVPAMFVPSGAGASELGQHLALFDRIAVSGSSSTPAVGFEDLLHQHFVDPILTKGGRTLLPQAPGCSTALKSASMSRYAYPKGAAWRPKSTSKGR